jgi:DNA-binding CsgD family transcriptional regulator/tetratricopeptide (TPR) repeat protein
MMESMGSGSSPFLGRRAELARLGELVGLDRDGPSAGGPDSGAVLLAGDAGVGKTRLLSELRDRAARVGWRVFSGHCLDFGDSAPPYLPFTEVFGRVATDWPGLGASLIDKQPALGRLMPGSRVLAADGTGEQMPRMERSDLFEAVYFGLGQIAQSAPLLLVIEDAHWADHSTREMLSFLFARRFAEPVAIVASYRGDDLGRRHPLRAVVGEWARLPGVTRMQLQPLADSDVRALVRSLHPGPLPETDVRGIVARAEGNAFFVEELVAAADLGRHSLPTDLVDLLLVRVDRLDEEVRLVVRAASVGGRRVSHQLLALVVEVDDVALERCVRSAVEANVLVVVGSDGYAFRHALLAEAIYDDLLPGERVRLHAAYARVLAAHEVEGTAADLARHARAANDVATGLRASIEAGDEAMAVGGPAEAAHHYEHALGFLADAHAAAGVDPPIDSVALALSAGDASVAAGNVHRAVALLEDQLRQLAADAPDTDRARLLHAVASAALQADTGFDALQATTEAVRLVPAEPATVLRAQVVTMHARANADRRRDDEAVMWASLALDLGTQLKLVDIIADATTTRARVFERAGHPEASRRALEAAVVDAAAAGEAKAEMRALGLLGSLHYTLGELPEAATVCRSAIKRARAYGRPWAPYGLDARVLAGIVAYTNGDWDEVISIADVSGESPPRVAEALLGSVGMAVAAGRGDHGALQVLAAVRPWWERDGQIAILSATAAIDLHGDRGELDEAMAVHDDTVACVGGMWQHTMFQARIRLGGLMLGQLCRAASFSGSQALVQLAQRGDDLAGAALATAAHGLGFGRPPAIEDQASPDSGCRQGMESSAWLARVTAEHLRLRWLTGVRVPDEDEMVSAWRRSVELFERFGHRFESARSQARLAMVLRATGHPEEAAAQADRARQTAIWLRAAPLLDEVSSLAPTVASRRSEPSRRDEALTGREDEVLALVALGRSNRDIGRQLFISAKTVSVHVSNLMAKLGASGRTEAVAIARRRGLLPDER